MGNSDLYVCGYGANILLTHVNNIEEEINCVERHDDIEHIHRLRVATRRIHSTLSIFHDYLQFKNQENWQVSFEILRKSLGTARDLDVKINLVDSIINHMADKKYLPGIIRLNLRLNQKRIRQQSVVIQTLEMLKKKNSIKKLKSNCTEFLNMQKTNPIFSNSIYQLSEENISSYYSRMIKFEPFIYQPDCLDEIHALRIGIKRLRYAVETFSPLYPDVILPTLKILRTAQDFLGEIHDCDLWVDDIQNFIIKEQKRVLIFYGNSRPYKRLEPGITFFLQERKDYRNKVYQEFVTGWARWRKENIFDNLLDTVHRYVVKNSYKLSDR